YFVCFFGTAKQMEGASQLGSLPKGGNGVLTGCKRSSDICEKLSAGEKASDCDIKQVLDDLADPEVAGRGAEVVYESIFLLLSGHGTGTGVGLKEEVVGGDMFLDRLTVRLQEDLRVRQGVTGSLEAARAGLKLVANLPAEALCKLLGRREASVALQDCVSSQPDTSLRSFAIVSMGEAGERCWSFLDRRPFLNGGFESGVDAQRFTQKVRDWVIDLFQGLVKQCEDPSHPVAASCFLALRRPLQHHLLCQTRVDEELDSFWGGHGRRGTLPVEAGYKQAFPLQHLAEAVLKSAMPSLRRLQLRERALPRRYRPPALCLCTILLVAALRLCRNPTQGICFRSHLLEVPSSTEGFLGFGGIGSGRGDHTSVADIWG
ncbi:unnamed protein product, partial [Choristocarpus tenellus]